VQAVKRNADRFPSDFMFQLSEAEFRILKSQIVISSWGGARHARPYAFTEQGVAMLSSVLRSRRAIQVNIAIMRTFVRLRTLLATHKDLARKLAELEKKYDADCWIFVTKFPCLACCNVIAQAGIKRIYTHDHKYWDDDPSDRDHTRKPDLLKQARIKVDAPFHPDFTPSVRWLMDSGKILPNDFSKGANR
jgi:hypothetical protein